MKDKENLKIATTIEQSKALIEMGVDTNTADMHYRILDKNNIARSVLSLGYDGEDDTTIPAWSVSNLIAMLPPLIIEQEKYVYTMSICHPVMTQAKYRVVYHCGQIYSSLCQSDNDCLIDSVVDVLDWLIQHGYKDLIKKTNDK